MEEIKNNAPRSLAKRRLRRPLSIIEKETILKVFEEYDIRHANCCFKSEVVHYTASATGFSVTSIYRVLTEQNKNGCLKPPSAHRKRKTLIDSLTEEDINYIRNKVHSLFMQNQSPTISTILAAVNGEAKYKFRRTSFWKVMKMLNISCVNESDNIKIEETELHDSNNYVQNEAFHNEICIKTNESPILEDRACPPASNFTEPVDIRHSTEIENTNLDAIEELPYGIKLENEEGLSLENCEQSCPNDLEEVDIKTEENEFLGWNNFMQNENITEVWIKTEDGENQISPDSPENNIELGQELPVHEEISPENIKSEPEETLPSLNNCEAECEGIDDNSTDNTDSLDQDMPIQEESQNENSNGIDTTINDASPTTENQESIQCKFCEYTTSNSSGMERHVVTSHGKLKNHKCGHCVYSATTSTALKKHIRRVHDKLKNHQCQLCERRFFNASSLKFHVNAVHHKLKNRKCDQCDFTATTSGNLRQHINAVHYKLKNYKCDHCDFSASQSSNLKFHVKAVHCKVKNFKCDFCDYSASALIRLKEHISAVHHKVKNQKCEYCDYVAFKSSTLIRHITAVHLKLKTHKCQYCSYAANQLTVLTMHIKSVHHKIKDQKCEHCNYTTSSASNLKKHIRSVHGNMLVI